MFGFESKCKEDHYQLHSTDPKLDMALINNLDSERDVGTINHEVKICDVNQLACSSMSHVKSKLVDLVELNPEE